MCKAFKFPRGCSLLYISNFFARKLFILKSTGLGHEISKKSTMQKNSNCGCRMNLNIEILIFNIEILIRNYLDCVASHKWRRIVGPHIYFSSQQSRFSLDLWFWTINFKVINLDVRTGLWYIYWIYKMRSRGFSYWYRNSVDFMCQENVWTKR